MQHLTRNDKEESETDSDGVGVWQVMVWESEDVLKLEKGLHGM